MSSELISNGSGRSASGDEFLELTLKGNKTAVLAEIIEFYEVCSTTTEFTDVTRPLEKISEYFRAHLDYGNASRVEFPIEQDEWQIWTKYKRALKDFQFQSTPRIRTHYIQTYEDLKTAIDAGRASTISEQEFLLLAQRLQDVATPAPSPVSGEYWSTIVPDVFSGVEVQNTIHRIGRLHQEFQCLTYRMSQKASAWLWTWRALRQMWLSHFQNADSGPTELRPRLLEVEIPFFKTWSHIFTRIDDSHEILHQHDIRRLVSSYSSLALRLLFDSKLDLTPATSDKAQATLDDFIRQPLVLRENQVWAVRRMAARYAVEVLPKSKVHPRTPPINKDYEEACKEDNTKQYPLPSYTSRYSAYDYVHYPFPETRQLATAYDQQIKRDLREPGIESDGLRPGDLSNKPRYHVQPTASAWRAYRSAGPFSVSKRLTELMFQYFIRGKKSHVRPQPRRPAAVVPRQIRRPFASQSKVDSPKKVPGRKPTSSLSSVKDAVRRVSKSSLRAHIPTTKLRGGGTREVEWREYWSSKQLLLIDELAERIGYDIQKGGDADWLVGELLTYGGWKVTKAYQRYIHAYPSGPGTYSRTERDFDMDIINDYGPYKADQIMRLLATSDDKGLADSRDIITQVVPDLEAANWRWEIVMEDCHKRKREVELFGHVVSDGVDEFADRGIVQEIETNQNEEVLARPGPRSSRSGSSANRKSRSARHSSARLDSNQENEYPGQNRGGIEEEDLPDYQSSIAEDQRLDSNQENRLPAQLPLPRSSSPRNIGSRNLGKVEEDGLRDYQSGILEVQFPEDISPSVLAQQALVARRKQQSGACSRRWAAASPGPQKTLARHKSGQSQPGSQLPKTLARGLHDHVTLFETSAAPRESRDFSPLLESPGLVDRISRSIQRERENKRNATQHCHPCPTYAGQYHHFCDALCTILDLPSEERQLRFTVRQYDTYPSRDASPYWDDLSTDVRRVLDETSLRSQNKPAMSNAQVHALLELISREVLCLLPRAPDEELRLPERLRKWSDFEFPTEDLKDSQLDADIFLIMNRFASLDTLAVLDEGAIPTELWAALSQILDIFYNRSPPSTTSDRARRGERTRPLGAYHKHAARLSRTLSELSRLFRDTSELDQPARTEINHRMYHEYYRAAHDDLLQIRRGLGETIAEQEWDPVPAWEHYRAHNVAPNKRMHAMMQEVLPEVESAMAFFQSGDPDVAPSTERLQWLMRSLGGILYDEAERGPSATAKEPVADRRRSLLAKTPGRKRKSKSPAAQDKNYNPQAGAAAEGEPHTAAGSTSPRRTRGSSKRTSAGPASDNTKKRKSPPADANDDQTATGPSSSKRGRKGPKSAATATTGAPTLPTEQHYTNMLVDELKKECNIRNIFVDKKLTKAKIVAVLLAADQVGNTGMGALNGYKIITGKTGARPKAFKAYMTRTEKEARYGDDLVPY